MDTLRLHKMYEMHRRNRATHAGGRRHLVRRIVIVGAGPVGLYAAYRLFTQTGADVEKRPKYTRKHFVEMDELFKHEMMWLLGTEYSELVGSNEGKQTGLTGLQVVCAKLELLMKTTLLLLAAYVKWMGENADRNNPSQLTLIYNARFAGAGLEPSGFAALLHAVPYRQEVGSSASPRPETDLMEVNGELKHVEEGRMSVIADAVLCTGGVNEAECSVHLGDRLVKTERQRYARINFFKGEQLAGIPGLGSESFDSWPSAAFSALGLHLQLYGVDQLLSKSSDAKKCLGDETLALHTFTSLKDKIRYLSLIRPHGSRPILSVFFTHCFCRYMLYSHPSFPTTSYNHLEPRHQTE